MILKKIKEKDLIQNQQQWEDIFCSLSADKENPNRFRQAFFNLFSNP